MIVKYSEHNYAAVYTKPRLNLILVINIIILDLYLNSKYIYTHPSMSLVLKKRRLEIFSFYLHWNSYETEHFKPQKQLVILPILCWKSEILLTKLQSFCLHSNKCMWQQDLSKLFFYFSVFLCSITTVSQELHIQSTADSAGEHTIMS